MPHTRGLRSLMDIRVGSCGALSEGGLGEHPHREEGKPWIHAWNPVCSGF